MSVSSSACASPSRVNIALAQGGSHRRRPHHAESMTNAVRSALNGSAWSRSASVWAGASWR